MRITSIINKYLLRWFRMEIRWFSKDVNDLRESLIRAKEAFGDREIVACEIGVLRGSNALNLLRNLNIKKIYLIDPYASYEDYDADFTSPIVDFAKENILFGLKKFKDNIQWVKKFSHEAYKDIDEKLDFVYIDGNHFEKYVMMDLTYYWDLLNDGGIISGHNYEQYGVKVSVDRFFSEKGYDVIIGEGGDWVVLKKLEDSQNHDKANKGGENNE